jgi:hypothetical protein
MTPYRTSKNKCSHDPGKIIDMLLTIKSLYDRLTKDVCQYARELETFQEYYQRFDINNEDMFDIMNKKLNQLLNLFYVAVTNHLSVTTNVKGLGEKIIKPVKPEYGKSTTLKYQNICKTCSDCNDCTKSANKCASKDRFMGCRDFLKVQSTLNVATYDNISITKLVNSSFVLLGYTLLIGNLSYELRNYTKVDNIKNVVQEVTDDSTYGSCPGDDDHLVQNIEKVTAKSIEALFEFIDGQIKILGDIEVALTTNIEYVEKYLKKFKCSYS